MNFDESLRLNSGMKQNTWENLVVETQFATELSLQGLRKLCTVPSGEMTGLSETDKHDYALHIGLYSYTSGLERLCKLAISCYGYVTEGEFSKFRPSHDLGELLNKVEGLDLTKISGNNPYDEYLARPIDSLIPAAIEMATRFATAKDGGRYEHLDSLIDEKTQVKTHTQWSNLATNSTISSDLERLLSLKRAMSDVVETLFIDNDLEATYSSILPEDRQRLYEPSVAAAITLFRLVRWASAVLNALTYNTKHDLPILGEVFNHVFLHPSTDFFNYHIARFSDASVVEEEITQESGS